MEFTENFSDSIGFIKIENFQIIIRKNPEIPAKYLSSIFLKFFLGKIDFLDTKNVNIFENSIHFLILCIVLKMKLRYLPGGPRPRTPAGGGA